MLPLHPLVVVRRLLIVDESTLLRITGTMLSAFSKCLSSSSTTKVGSYTDVEKSSPIWIVPAFSACTVIGPPKSVVLICLNVIPYTFLRPIAQYLFVAQSGGAPKTNLLAIVLLPP